MRWPRWWPWRAPGRHRLANGAAAARAKAEAQERLRAQQRQWPEVRQARDEFAAAVERALRGAR